MTYITTVMRIKARGPVVMDHRVHCKTKMKLSVLCLFVLCYTVRTPPYTNQWGLDALYGRPHSTRSRDYSFRFKNEQLSWKILSYFVANLSKTLRINFYQNRSSIVEVMIKKIWCVFYAPQWINNNYKQVMTLIFQVTWRHQSINQSINLFGDREKLKIIKCNDLDSIDTYCQQCKSSAGRLVSNFLEK